MMTSKQVMERFFVGSVLDRQEYRLFLRAALHHIADHWYQLQLLDGQRMNDATDAALGLRELAEAARVPGTEPESMPAPKVTQRPAQPRWDRTCPDCAHEHEGRNDCGKYLGEGKFCQCESKVTA
jgi:hypothetical protein